MKGVDFVGVVFLVDNQNDTAAHGDKVGMRNFKTVAIRETDCERLEITSKPFPDVLEIQHTTLLSQRRLRFRFFHERRADLFAELDELDLAHRREAGPGRDQVTHDHVFFEAAQAIDFA